MVKFHSLEKIIRRAPLGLRFVDAVSGADIMSGLTVTGWREGTTYPYFTAQRSQQSGIYGYATLPEYRRFEPTDDTPAPPVDPVNYFIYVRDTLGRFLPQTHIIEIPQENVQTIELYSQPARPVQAGLAVIRGELWDTTNERGAGWAKLQAEIAGKSYETVADARGMFVLYVPFAGTFPQPPIDMGNPGGGQGGGQGGGGNNGGNGGSQSLNELSWDVTITVDYNAEDQVQVAGLRDDKPPTMASINAQSTAEIEDDSGGSGETSITRSLQYQQELIVKSTGENESRLRLIPDDS